MRRARWLILLAILALVTAVAFIYRSQRRTQRSLEVAAPPPLASNLSAAAQNWSYTQMDGDRPVVSISARSFAESRDATTVDLEDVELKIYHKDAQEFDRVRSAKVAFDKNAGSLYSEGDVDITMGVPVAAKPQGRLLTIRSSGVRFDSRTGRAETGRAASFRFDLGEGQAAGAVYDPKTRELFLASNVQLLWRGSKPKGKVMKLEAGQLVYKEKDSLVVLTPWAKLTREQMTLEAGPSIVHLEEGVIQLVEAENARGSDRYPNRTLEYAASRLRMEFDEDGVARLITGTGNARLVSSAQTARTTMTGDRVDLDFATESGESVLRKSLVSGHAVAETRPVPRPNVPTPDTRIIRSETIELLMRAGGREIDRMSTHAAGHIEFLPNRPGQPRREMDAERMTAEYAEQNRIRYFRAVSVATKTMRETTQKGKPAVALTWSKDLSADFEPKTGQLTKLEQWQDFRYEEGQRKARADHATMESKEDRILLQGNARFADTTGSTAADRIVLDQKSRDFEAEGQVTSTRLAGQDSENAAMFSADEPLQAKANRMYTRDEQNLIHFEGNVILWNGANRLQADTVAIDRGNDALHALGHVFTQLVDRRQEPPGTPASSKAAGKKAAPVYTVARSPELFYNGEEKLAHYRGGATLARPNLDVKAQEIKAWFKDEEGGGSSLDRALATGTADILRRSPGRTRRFTGERVEYLAGEEKVTVEGGEPQLVDSLRGSTRGRKLTWCANDDKLIVDGAERQPARSLIRRSK